MAADDCIIKQYKEFKRREPRWEFGNDILYRMCKEYPSHEDDDAIAGKIWLIGRSYATAIERKNRDIYNNFQNDDFYYDIVVPKLLKKGKELDERIKELKNTDKKIEECVSDILETYNFLMKAFKDITGQSKGSLASTI